MSTADYKSQGAEHHRRESEMSAPVSDYEYFQFSPAVARAPPTPPTPQTPAAPPIYTGANSPISSPPFTHHSSHSGTAPLIGEEHDRHTSYPEVVPEGHQVTPKAPEYQRHPDHGEKEAYVTPRTYSQYSQPKFEPDYNNVQQDPVPVPETKAKKRYPFGLTRKLFLAAIIALVLLIIAIAVGVGVGVGLGTSKHHGSSSKSNKDPLYAIGGAYDPKYYSTEGAFNGSGIALADVNFGLDNSIYVFYQSYTGEVEQIIYESDGSWNFVTQVATNAKNSTPLSTVAYIVDYVATWHLFYISEDNTLKQRVQTNSSTFQTNIWEDGPLNDLNLSVYDGDTVGMQACYWGNYYGSLVNYNDAVFQASNSTPTIGMNIWYADTETSFQQYDWTNGQAQWNHTRTWNNQNGHAGIGCQSWLSDTINYVFMVDTNNTVQIYWKDINTNVSSTDSHPINQYTLASEISVPNVHPSTSLGYTDFMIYQGLDGAIHGVNVTWGAENTTIAPAQASSQGAAESTSNNLDEWALQPQDVGIGGTHMAITGSLPKSGGRQELLFYQMEGNNLRLGKRDSDGGDFSFVTVPLSDLKGH